jgi:hypothetical protein
MINKRAIVGRTLTSISVLIILVLIIAVYLVAAYGISKFKGPDEKRASGIMEGNLLPIETINVKVGDKIESMWVLDALTLLSKGKLDRKDFYSDGALGDLALRDNKDKQVVLVRTSATDEMRRPLPSAYNFNENVLVQCDSGSYPTNRILCMPSTTQIIDYVKVGLTNDVYFKVGQNYKILEYYYGNQRLTTYSGASLK